MEEIVFLYEGKQILIQCNLQDKMKDIINQFENKIDEDDNDLCFIYNGQIINEELILNEIIKDKNKKKISIIVYNCKDEENEREIILNEIECPECKGNILINIKDYKVNLYDCKNGHKKENILLTEYEKIQKLDLSKIICYECNNNRNNVYNKEFYICNECGINLCPLCKSKHDKTHNIINYNNRNYICRKHNDKYIKYCKECKEDVCFNCINEHNYHNIIELSNIIPNKEELLQEMKYINEIINILKNNIEEIKNMLNSVLNNFEIYYKIFNINIINYNNNRSYEKYFNLNEIKKSNRNIINDIYYIINENNLNKKFKNFIEIYYKIIRNKKEKIYAINVIKIIIILMKNYIYVMNVILIYVHYVNINMIKIIILLIIMIRIIYVKSIMINI
jgi:hypothetical protein